MFGVRRRWPILTAFGAALLYVANNYQIVGLEHLTLRPLDSPQQVTEFDPNPGNAYSGLGSGLGFDLTQLGIQHAPISGGNSVSGFGLDPYSAQPAPAWKNLLSMGEKLALWQDKITPPKSTGEPEDAYSGSSFSASLPIPMPQGLMPQGLMPQEIALPVSPWNGLQGSANSTTQSVDGIPSGKMTSSLSPRPNNSGFGAPAASSPSIRIASFHVPSLGPAMLNKPHVVETLVSILRQYDLVALQGIQTSRDDILPLIVDKLNQSGRSYDYLVGPRVGRAAAHQQYSFVFDTNQLETDRYQLYTIDDPEDLMAYEPLVAWFRCKGLPSNMAFTFTVINVCIEPSFADAERAVLPALIDAIERDGRREDDWILTGDFAGGTQLLTPLLGSGVRFAISDMPTDVAGTRMLDTMIFSARATSEFTGRAGAFDFLRKNNLSLEQALEVSQHMPIWAEFSRLEGSEPGRIAPIDSARVN